MPLQGLKSSLFLYLSLEIALFSEVSSLIMQIKNKFQRLKKLLNECSGREEANQFYLLDDCHSYQQQPNKLNIIIAFMQSHIGEHQDHEISSSEERCKCAQCKNQLELQLSQKKPLSNIYLYRHLKKRQGPPIKKDVNKDVTVKPKPMPKLELQVKLAATPLKHKQDRSKETNPSLLPSQYHMVSHLQRTKGRKQEITEQDGKREERLRPKVRSGYEGLRLAEINENPQSIKIEHRNISSAERGRIDASPIGMNPDKIDVIGALIKK